MGPRGAKAALVFAAVLVCGLVLAAVVTGAGSVLSPGSWSLQPGGVYTLSVPPQDTVTVTNTVTTTVTTTTTAPPATTANAWVNTTAGATPSRCATACVYDPAKAYGSLNAARAAASCGDTVLVRGGSYGAQTINPVNGSCSQNVLVKPDGGAAVSMPSLNVQSSFTNVNGITATGAVTVENTNASQVCTTAGVPTNITLAGVSGAYVEVLGAVSNTTVSGGLSGGGYGGTNDGSH